MENIYKQIDTNRICFLSYNPFNTNYDINKFIQLKKYNIPEINKDSLNLSIFNIYQFPTILILDSNLKIIKEFIGDEKGEPVLLNKFLEEYNLLKK
ncbi:MAG: hypothetical protein H7321_00350 [Bacteroidia bacterium]|nr:hypothetical protein [Bacteroidia bacterium]